MHFTNTDVLRKTNIFHAVMYKHFFMIRIKSLCRKHVLINELCVLFLLACDSHCENVQFT